MSCYCFILQIYFVSFKWMLVNKSSVDLQPIWHCWRYSYYAWIKQQKLTYIYIICCIYQETWNCMECFTQRVEHFVIFHVLYLNWQKIILVFQFPLSSSLIANTPLILVPTNVDRFANNASTKRKPSGMATFDFSSCFLPYKTFLDYRYQRLRTTDLGYLFCFCFEIVLK